MPSRVHEDLIDRAIAELPGARTSGFREAIERAIDEPHELRGLISIRPDAFLIDREQSKIIAIEVEVAHRIPEAKMGLYCDLHWALEFLHWEGDYPALDTKGALPQLTGRQTGAFLFWKITFCLIVCALMIATLRPAVALRMRAEFGHRFVPDPGYVEFVQDLREMLADEPASMG